MIVCTCDSGREDTATITTTAAGSRTQMKLTVSPSSGLMLQKPPLVSYYSVDVFCKLLVLAHIGGTTSVRLLYSLYLIL